MTANQASGAVELRPLAAVNALSPETRTIASLTDQIVQVGVLHSVRVNRDDLAARLRDQVGSRFDHEVATGEEDSEAVVRAELDAAGVPR